MSPKTSERSRIPDALRLLRFADHERALDEAVGNHADETGDVLDATRTFDAPSGDVVRQLGLSGVAVNATYELAFIWRPHDVPTTMYFYCNNDPIPGAHGTFTGGRMIFTIPEAMVKLGANEIAFVLRFWQSNWQYQLWARDHGNALDLIAQDDPDGSSTADDSVIKKVTFTVGAGS